MRLSEEEEKEEEGLNGLGLINRPFDLGLRVWKKSHYDYYNDDDETNSSGAVAVTL